MEASHPVRLLIRHLLTCGLYALGRCGEPRSNPSSWLQGRAARNLHGGKYQPVCGTNPAGMRVTYSNASLARIAQATNVTRANALYHAERCRPGARSGR